MRRFLKYIRVVIRTSYLLLTNSNPLILASSTAFFTTFSISPIIILLVNLLSFYFDTKSMSDQLFVILKETFGNQAEKQLEAMVYNLTMIEGKGWITIVNFIVLLFVATTLLKVVKQSIHVIWHISSKPDTQMKVNLLERSKALALLLLIGFLFILSLVFDGSVAILKQYFVIAYPSLTVGFMEYLNFGLSLFLVTIWLTMLFLLLPDAHVSWDIALAGGFVTGILFNVGKLILGYFLIHSRMVNIFGASTSFALILLFIFYSSFSLYFGAAFTHAHGQFMKKPIRPGRYSQRYEQQVLPEK